MPREDRQLLMLRFVREVDQSVDYEEVNFAHQPRAPYEKSGQVCTW